MILLIKKDFHKKEKVLDFLIIISVLGLVLLIVSPVYYSDSNNFSSSQAKPVLKLIPASNTEEPGFSMLIFPDENSRIFQKIEQYVDLVYTFGGVGAAVLIILMYRHMASKEKELIENPPKDLYPYKIWKKLELEETNQEKYEITRIRLLTAIPVVCIILAELLIFSGRTKLAVWMHIGILIAFSLSHLFVQNLKIYRIYEALMFLPILRLVNLSMPVFFESTLYAFIFTYGPLMVPLFIVVAHQQRLFEKSGSSIWSFPTCISLSMCVSFILSIYVSFLLGLGEYMIIRPGYLIPDLSIENLLKLTFIMVFFVGLTEELIFRSILQTRLEEVLGIREGLIITSLLFGFMHSGYGTFYEIPYACLSGLLIGYSFYKTRSLPFVTVVHGFINVFLFGILPHNISNWIWV